MKSARLSDLELSEGWYENDETVRWRDTIPLTPGMPGASEVVAEDSVVVYFEMEPGNGVGTHTDSEEELLLVIEGHVSVTVDDGEGDLAADEMAVVPRKAPHSVRNVGNETAP